ncbi:ShlB/FhaC/HecB family hemolysin secretion/activation protein, partial [Ralstonia pseudosolanacearum]
MSYHRSRLAVLLFGAAASTALAQVAPAPVTGPGPEVQRLQEQQTDQTRDRANARPDVFTAPAPAQPISLSALP